MTIELGKHGQGTHLFQLLTVNGQTVLHKELWLDENARTFKIDIPPVASGTYFLKIVNKKTGKVNTKKIIVE